MAFQGLTMMRAKAVNRHGGCCLLYRAHRVARSLTTSTHSAGLGTMHDDAGGDGSRAPHAPTTTALGAPSIVSRMLTMLVIRSRDRLYRELVEVVAPCAVLKL